VLWWVPGGICFAPVFCIMIGTTPTTLSFVEFVFVFVHMLGLVGVISHKTKTFCVFVIVIVQ
jgi:hypothetical protein